jgi:hypothetical protein
MSFDLKIENGGLVLSKGDLKKVVDSEKLIQDILKMALTEAGSNPEHPWYGSYLSQSMIGSTLDETVAVNLGKDQLKKSLDNLMRLQGLQSQTYQVVTPDEMLGVVLDITIDKDRGDPRLFWVRIVCRSKGLKPITTAFKVSTI